MTAQTVGSKVVFGTALTDTATTDIEGIGTLRWDGDKLYRWVKNGEATAQAAGNLVCHQFSNGSTAIEHILTPLTADLGFMAGVCISAIPATPGYGWIQVLGYGGAALLPHTQTTGSYAAGDYLTPVNAVTYSSTAAKAATQPNYIRNIQIMGTAATTTTPTLAIVTTNPVMVNCL